MLINKCMQMRHKIVKKTSEQKRQKDASKFDSFQRFRTDSALQTWPLSWIWCRFTAQSTEKHSCRALIPKKIEDSFGRRWTSQMNNARFPVGLSGPERSGTQPSQNPRQGETITIWVSWTTERASGIWEYGINNRCKRRNLHIPHLLHIVQISMTPWCSMHAA